MKLVAYIREIPHRKNWSAIARMCRSCNVEFEATSDLNRLRQSDYDILYAMMEYVDPETLPSHVKAIYGPQFWVVPTPPIAGPLRPDLVGRCVFNSLSKWVGDFYLEMAKEFVMPIVQFPFSVDTDAFQPVDTPKDVDCIVYIKRRSNALVMAAIDMLAKQELQFRVFRYGSYSESDYKSTLARSKFMLCLDAHESQGFALEEAMASGVPLLVVDATSMYDEMDDGIHATYEHLRPNLLAATSVPYWSDECGIRITEKNDLPHAIHTMLATYRNFTPRDYILRTLSDDVCMRRILDFAQGVVPVE